MTEERSIHTVIAELAEPLAASLGLRVWGVEVAFGKRGIVRIFVDAPAGVSDGVDIERCADLSRLIGMALDVEDCIRGAYTLEVSSPGLERTFFTEDQLTRAVGQTVAVTLHEPLPELPGRKKLQGVLEQAEDGVFRLAAIDLAAPAAPPVPVRFSFTQIKKAKQVLAAPEKVLPGKGKKKKAADAESQQVTLQKNCRETNAACRQQK